MNESINNTSFYMKDFWQKTKETFAVGVAKADEFINDKKIETDADYVQRETQLEDMDKYISGLHKNLEEMNGNIKRAGNLISQIGNDFKNSISTTSPEFTEFSTNAQEAGSNIHMYTEKAFVFYYPTHVLSPLNQAMIEIKNLKNKNEECKKAHILLNKSEENLNRSRNGKNQNTEKYQQEVDERKATYERLHADFIESVDDLMKRKGQICSESYTACVTYIDELMKVAHEQFEHFVPQCCFGANDKFPSIQSETTEGTTPAAKP